MKKIFSMALVACMAAFVMTSCNGKNEPQKPDDSKDTTEAKPDTVAVAAYMEFNFEANSEMLNVFTLGVEYYDENSQLKKEDFTGSKIIKKITTKGLPAKTGVRLVVEKRADLDTTVVKEFVSEYSYSYITYAVNKDGQRANRFEYSGGSSGEHVVNPISLIDRYIAGFSKDRYQVFEFDANGEPEAKTWE